MLADHINYRIFAVDSGRFKSKQRCNLTWKMIASSELTSFEDRKQIWLAPILGQYAFLGFKS
jgi:hypothetical protein